MSSSADPTPTDAAVTDAVTTYSAATDSATTDEVTTESTSAGPPSSAPPSPDATSADPAPAAPEPGGRPDCVPVEASRPTGPPGWEAFAERPVPDGLGQAVHLGHELAGVLQRSRDDLAKDRGRAAQESADVLGSLYELAALAGQLELQLARAETPLVEGGNKRLHDLLRVLKNQMLEELRQRGIEVRDPLGRGHDEVAEWADVVHWRSGPQFTAEVVAQTIEPAVFHHGRDDHDAAGDDDKVVRRARVVMGCPEPEAP
ncbi:hypothetical protein ACIRPX_34715 [Streptomyces sp. NPDC101225]|uniref:hypothetical protein n=1 Tax=Streptomyces sp. NPDC101225 TaxID=3366135 RepID=UPI00380857F3